MALFKLADTGIRKLTVNIGLPGTKHTYVFENGTPTEVDDAVVEHLRADSRLEEVE